MRKLFSIFAVVCASLFAMSCEGPQGGPSGDGASFKFGEAKITANAIEVAVTPSDSAVNYCASFYPSAVIADMDDAELIDMCLNADNFRTRKGTQIIAANGLTPETSYTLVVFALTESKVTRQEYTTIKAEEPLPADEFNVEIEVKDITATSATAIATPNGSNRYYFRVITKMELDAFGIYNDDYQIFEYILENPNSGEWITEGTTTLNCRLAAETDYLAVAFNFENWEAMHNQQEELKLFRKAFTTPEGQAIDPDSLFVYSNLQATHTGVSVDVTPAQGDDSFWGYYIWTKKSYDETLANEAKANIVMRSYFGLNNIGVEQGYDFGTFIREYLGQTGSSTVINYEPLKNNTEYVLVLFYMDPEVTDPTNVYDYNYVAIPFKTKEPSTETIAKLEVSEAVIVKNGFKYDVQFLVKTDDNAVDMKIGAQLWNNYDFAKYWNPNDWSQIQAFFMFRTSVEPTTLEAAKTAEGATVSFPGVDKDDYVFFFEVINEENTPTQYAVRVTPEMFDNAQ